jgi:hypothetical protein
MLVRRRAAPPGRAPLLLLSLLPLLAPCALSLICSHQGRLGGAEVFTPNNILKGLGQYSCADLDVVDAGRSGAVDLRIGHPTMPPLSLPTLQDLLTHICTHSFPPVLAITLEPKSLSDDAMGHLLRSIEQPGVGCMCGLSDAGWMTPTVFVAILHDSSPPSSMWPSLAWALPLRDRAPLSPAAECFCSADCTDRERWIADYAVLMPSVTFLTMQHGQCWRRVLDSADRADQIGASVHETFRHRPWASLSPTRSRLVLVWTVDSPAQADTLLHDPSLRVDGIISNDPSSLH